MLGNGGSRSGIENPRFLFRGRFSETEGIDRLLGFWDDVRVVSKDRLHSNHVGLAVHRTVWFGTGGNQRNLR